MSLLKSPVSRFYTLSMAILTLSTVLIFYALYNAVFAREVMTVREPLLVVNHGNIRPGGHVTVVFDYCQNFPAHATTGAYIASQGTIIPLSLTSSALPFGCHNVKLLYHIPDFVPPAVYKLYVTREYRLTLVEQKAYLLESEPFEVLPR